MQYQFVGKKQTVHPAAPNSHTLVDGSMTVYPIYTDQGSPKCMGEDDISYCTTVRGPEIFRNAIFSGCYILPNQHIFRKYNIFSLLAKCIAGGAMASQVGFGPRAIVSRALV